jgi:hypothetical protein
MVFARVSDVRIAKSDIQQPSTLRRAFEPALRAGNSRGRSRRPLPTPLAPDVGLATLFVTAPIWAILGIADHFSPVWLRAPIPFAVFPQSGVVAGTESRGAIRKRNGGGMCARELSSIQCL